VVLLLTCIACIAYQQVLLIFFDKVGMGSPGGISRSNGEQKSVFGCSALICSVICGFLAVRFWGLLLYGSVALCFTPPRPASPCLSFFDHHFSQDVRRDFGICVWQFCTNLLPIIIFHKSSADSLSSFGILRELGIFLGS